MSRYFLDYYDIKYRAKVVGKEEYVYGYLIPTINYGLLIYEKEPIINNFPEKGRLSLELNGLYLVRDPVQKRYTPGPNNRDCDDLELYEGDVLLIEESGEEKYFVLSFNQTHWAALRIINGGVYPSRYVDIDNLLYCGAVKVGMFEDAPWKSRTE